MRYLYKYGIKLSIEKDEGYEREADDPLITTVESRNSNSTLASIITRFGTWHWRYR